MGGYATGSFEVVSMKNGHWTEGEAAAVCGQFGFDVAENPTTFEIGLVSREIPARIEAYMQQVSELLAQCELDPSTCRIAIGLLVKQRCGSAGILNILSTIRDVPDCEGEAGAAQKF